MGKKVALIERNSGGLGGVCLHTGTIPSKTMREAILHLTGYRQRGVYTDQFRQKRKITMDDLRRILVGRAAFYSRADLVVDTSAQSQQATFAALRARVRQARAQAA